MSQRPPVLFILPSTRLSGGVLETLRLASELCEECVAVRVLSLWNHRNSFESVPISGIPDLPIDSLLATTPRKWRAPWDMLRALARYPFYLRHLKRSAGDRKPVVVTTHYSTLLFGWFSTRERRYSFVQDEEWLFVSAGILRQALRGFILFTLRRSQVITSNPYISDRMRAVGIQPSAEASIWASKEFLGRQTREERQIDVVMVLRKGYVKRADLYMQFLRMAKEKNAFSCAVITCENDLAREASVYAKPCLLRPSSEAMRKLFAISKIFLLLSEREGFALPPLEAMGSGCIPVCRDAGGPVCYMQGALADNLIPLVSPMEEILKRVNGLLKNPEKLAKLSHEAICIFQDEGERAKRSRLQAVQRLVSVTGNS